MFFERKGAKAQSSDPPGNRRSSFASLRLCARTLFLILATAVSAYPQSPDLSSLEKEVRDQITTLQAFIVAFEKYPSPSPTQLSDAYARLAKTYHAYSLFAPAYDNYVTANKLAPKDFRWVYLLAKLHHQEGLFDAAIRRYQLARTMRPDYVATHVNLGNIYLELNRLEDASANFNAALEIDPNNPAAHYGLGQVAISKRNYSQAVDHFEKTLAQVPGANRVHYSLAMAYRGLGDAQKVKTHLAQQGTVGVRVADPLFDGLQELITGERVHLARGKLAFEAQRYADAAAQFRKAVESNPDSVTARINLGAALTQTGDLAGAIEQFEAALRIEPGKANAHYNLAVIFARQNNHAQAVDHLHAALKVDPNDLNARMLLARELAALGRCTEAAEWHRGTIAAAEQAGKTELLPKLKTDLKTYEQQASCRP